MGRSPGCNGKGAAPAGGGINKGPWTEAEDEILSTHIKVHGESNWRLMPKLAGLQRCGKSCRLRWINYLRPDLKRGNFSPAEDDLIITLHALLGNRWSLIAGRIPGRTDNEIKNYWNTHLRRKLKSMGINPSCHIVGQALTSSSGQESADADQEDGSDQKASPSFSEDVPAAGPGCSQSGPSLPELVTSPDSSFTPSEYSTASEFGSSISYGNHQVPCTDDPCSNTMRYALGDGPLEMEDPCPKSPASILSKSDLLASDPKDLLIELDSFSSFCLSGSYGLEFDMMEHFRLLGSASDLDPLEFPSVSQEFHLQNDNQAAPWSSLW